MEILNGKKQDEGSSFEANGCCLDNDHKMKTQQDCLQRIYRDLEFNVIPVSGKFPPCESWKRWETERLPIATLCDWGNKRMFQKKKGGRYRLGEDRILNWGLPTGDKPYSNSPAIIVIDTDDKEAERIVSERCPATPVKQRTGSGGWHRIYRRPEKSQIDYISNRQKAVIDGRTYNIDIRGDHGYILCPGSIHPKTGQLYAWDQPWTRELIESCPVFDPAWIPGERESSKKQRQPSSHAPRSFEFEKQDEATWLPTVDLRRGQFRAYLKARPGAEQGQGADNYCLALAITGLYGFALPGEDVFDELFDWGQRDDQVDEYGGWYPWSAAEIQHKVNSAGEKDYDGETGDKLLEFEEHRQHDLEQRLLREYRSNPSASHVDDGSANPPSDSEEDGRHIISASTPKKTARIFYSKQFGDKSLWFQGPDIWRRWDGHVYRNINEQELRSQVSDFLEGCVAWDKKKEALIEFAPTPQKERDVLQELKNLCTLPSSKSIPSWIGVSGPEPSNVVAFQNGLLDLSRFLAGDESVRAHSPNWYSLHCLPHDFDGTSKCPEWQKFLSQVFEEDEERIRLLQQWFGYCLTADTSQEKFLLLFGKPRSGKGTVTTVLGEVLGRHNVDTPRFKTLGREFGLHSLIGKLVAMIPDAHLPRGDNSDVLEVLKAITGNDTINIERKHQQAIENVKLNARIVISTNQLPKFVDNSAALSHRAIILPFGKSFAGKEDRTLKDRLRREVVGITNWALQGLADLRRSGQLIIPKSSQHLHDSFRQSLSTIGGFVETCCELADNLSTSKDDLYQVYRSWCFEEGHQPVAKNRFLPELQSVESGINTSRPRIDNPNRRWCYNKIGLNSPGHSLLKRSSMVR